MNPHKAAKPEHPIQDLIAQRWSPYVYDSKPVQEEDLKSLFTAASWAASSYNEQPWRYIVATKADPDEFARMHACLVEGNQAWTQVVPVLAIGCTSLKFERNGKPNAAAIHDLGLASATLTFEATARGLYVHQMIGILPDKVRETYGVPEDVQPLTALAIGYVANPESNPALKDRDLAPRMRKALKEFVFSGKYGQPVLFA